MRGGQAALAVHVPEVSQPKSKPEMLTPANFSFPALEGGLLGAQVDDGAAGAEDGLVGATLVGTVVGAVIGGGVGVPGLGVDDGARLPGKH